MLLVSCVNPFKVPMTEQQDIKSWILKAEKEISKDNWREAQKIGNELSDGWGSIRKRISLNASSDEMTQMDIAIEQFKVYVKEEDKTVALAEVERLKQLWQTLASL
ncbi:DUF4363 family protein [Ammoniphilus sp. CFH 90114]|nr:DUF4363 family protein [Ammoniphilus sp. CFH 90114]